MKHSKNLLRALALMTALIFSIAVVSPALADLPQLPEADKEKLLAFWQQEAYDGMTNGEAVYVYEFPEGANTLFHPTYPGTYYTDLVHPTFQGAVPGFGLEFMYTIPYSIVVGDDCADCFLEVTPDLYGALDLADTSLMYLASPDAGQTHISSVDIDNCEMLYSAMFNGQEGCTSFSALGCTALETIQLLDGAFRNIAVGCGAYSEPILVSAFGSGSVGMAFSAGGNITLKAYPAADMFIGWFNGEERISEALECTVENGGNYRAVFAGDADGNSQINVADAVLALRMAMGIVGTDAANPADVNGNGVVEIADAIMILRFAMGVL